MAGKERKAIKSFDDRFLERLEKLCDGQDIAISNAEMRKSLNWADDRYEKTKASLLVRKLIKPAPGHGGKVRFVTFPVRVAPKQALKVFVSYSHSDEELKQELVKHLYPLTRLGMIESWDDRLIKPGDEWGGEIDKALEAADIIILVISVDFINSRYCYDVELKRAMERHEAREAKVIPVIARHCLWHHAPFGKLQALPKDAKAVSTWLDRDNALTTVAENVFKIAERLLAAEND
jgi:hypothetical protein